MLSLFCSKKEFLAKAAFRICGFANIYEMVEDILFCLAQKIATFLGTLYFY